MSANLPHVLIWHTDAFTDYLYYYLYYYQYPR